MLALVLAIALQSEPRTATVVQHDKVTMMELAQAESTLATTNDESLRAALTLAIGTVRCTEDEANGLVVNPRGQACHAQRKALLL